MGPLNLGPLDLGPLDWVRFGPAERDSRALTAGKGPHRENWPP